MSEGIADAFRNSGQACGGLTRVLVPRERLEDAAGIAADTARSYVLGDPFDATTTLGPVTTAGQFDRVRSYIRTGIEEERVWSLAGWRCLRGSRAGYFVEPTIFTGDNTIHVAARGDLRARRRHHPVRRRTRGHRSCQRLRVRPGGRCVVCRRRACSGCSSAAPRWSRSHQRVARQPARTARRLQTVRHRPGVGSLRDRGVPGVPGPRIVTGIPRSLHPP